MSCLGTAGRKNLRGAAAPVKIVWLPFAAALSSLLTTLLSCVTVSVCFCACVVVAPAAKRAQYTFVQEARRKCVSSDRQ